jgi:hypothetical protein
MMDVHKKGHKIKMEGGVAQDWIVIAAREIAESVTCRRARARKSSGVQYSQNEELFRAVRPRLARSAQEGSQDQDGGRRRAGLDRHRREGDCRRDPGPVLRARKSSGVQYSQNEELFRAVRPRLARIASTHLEIYALSLSYRLRTLRTR